MQTRDDVSAFDAKGACRSNEVCDLLACGLACLAWALERSNWLVGAAANTAEKAAQEKDESISF